MTKAPPPAPHVPASTVLAAVAARFEVPVERILGKGRAQMFTRPRSAAAWLLRRTGGDYAKQTRSYPRIGRLLGGRDHSTAINSERCCEDWMRTDAEYRAAVEGLLEALSSGSASPDGSARAGAGVSLAMILPPRPEMALPKPACAGLADNLPTIRWRNDFSAAPETRSPDAIRPGMMLRGSTRLRDAVLAELVAIAERRANVNCGVGA